MCMCTFPYDCDKITSFPYDCDKITSLELRGHLSSPQPIATSSHGEDPLIMLVAAAPDSSTAWNKDRSPSK